MCRNTNGLVINSELYWGPKFTLGAPVPPVRPRAENFFIPEASTLLFLIAFLILIF